MIPSGRLVGLDLGSRRVGVAVSDNDRIVAIGVRALVRCGDRARDHAAVAQTVEEYSAVGVIVGVPLSLSGAQGPAATAVLAEVEELRRALAVPVDTVDERLTTVVAAGALRRGGRPARRQRPVVDQTAAALLLQTWMDREAGAREVPL